MAHTYQEAQNRALELNKQLKGSSKFARPVKDTFSIFGWNVEIVCSKNLMKEYQEDQKQEPHKRKFHF